MVLLNRSSIVIYSSILTFLQFFTVIPHAAATKVSDSLLNLAYCNGNKNSVSVSPIFQQNIIHEITSYLSNKDILNFALVSKRQNEIIKKEYIEKRIIEILEQGDVFDIHYYIPELLFIYRGPSREKKELMLYVSAVNQGAFEGYFNCMHPGGLTNQDLKELIDTAIRIGGNTTKVKALTLLISSQIEGKEEEFLRVAEQECTSIECIRGLSQSLKFISESPKILARMSLIGSKEFREIVQLTLDGNGKDFYEKFEQAKRELESQSQ